MTRKSNAMYDPIHIDPVYIVVSILIDIVIHLNIRRSLLNRIIYIYDTWSWIECMMKLCMCRRSSDPKRESRYQTWSCID